MQLHIFRYVDNDESCERSYSASAHHSGICWCIGRDIRNWVYPSRDHGAPGEGYFIMPVRETESISSGQFCGTDDFQLPSTHVYASPSTDTGPFQHFVNCWCSLRITIRTPMVDLMPVDWQYKYLPGEPATVDRNLRTAHELSQPGRGGRSATMQATRAALTNEINEFIQRDSAIVDSVRTALDNQAVSIAATQARAPPIGRESELPAVILATVQSDEVLCEILSRRISAGTPFYRCGCGWIGFNPQAAEHQNSNLTRDNFTHADWQSARDVSRAIQLIAESPANFREQFYADIAIPISTRTEPVTPVPITDSFHILRPATIVDRGYDPQRNEDATQPVQETHSAACWCQQTRASGVEGMSNNYHIRRVRVEEMPTILGRPFSTPTLHYYIVDPSDGEHLHDSNCWCMLLAHSVERGRDYHWNELFQLAPDWTRRIESSEEAQAQSLIADRDNEDDDDYEEEDEREQVNPMDRFAQRVRIPEGARRERHLLRPSDEELRHTSACWCMAEPGLTGQWRAMSDYGNEHVFEITPDDYSQIVGRPFGAYNPLHMFVSRGDEEEHFANCWCRISVPHEGTYVGDIPDGRVYFRLRRTPASDMGLQGQRACFVCGWTALNHELTRTKKGLRLKCPDVKNPEMRNLNLTRPQVSQ